jgi:hypothetical protein
VRLVRPVSTEASPAEYLEELEVIGQGEHVAALMGMIFACPASLITWGCVGLVLVDSAMTSASNDDTPRRRLRHGRVARRTLRIDS